MVVAWVTPADLPTGTPGGEAELDAACAQATAVLFGLSGRRWPGTGTRTIEVLASEDPWWWRDALLGLPWGSTGYGGPPMLPVLVGGELSNITGRERRAIRLPDFPVRAVTAVRVAGETRDPDSYRLIGNRYLEAAGPGGWPWLGLDAGRTMEVDYAYGADPPAVGRAAAARLAAELAKAAAGQPTALTGYIMARVRQGETVTYVRTDLLFDKGRTGLADVDLWLATVNPSGLRRRARSWSPDTDPRYRTVPTGGTP